MATRRTQAARLSEPPRQLPLASVVQREIEGLGHAGGAAIARLFEPGVPPTGVLVLHCDRCGARRRLRLRGRERSATALLRAIPRVPVRHWVLSVPKGLRVALAEDAAATTRVMRAFVREIFALVRASAARQGLDPRGHVGAVSLVHRSGGALDLNVHVHALVLDGVYVRGPGDAPVFHPLRDEPDPAAIEALALRMDEVLRAVASAAARPRDGLRALRRASVRQEVATGPRAGTSIRRVRAEPVRHVVAPLEPGRVGARVHATARIAADDRGALLRLSRYLARAPVDARRLEPSAGGTIRYRLARPFADGTTHVEFAPRELAERLLALVPHGPAPRIAYHGVIAPRAARMWQLRPTQLALVEIVRAPATGRGRGSPARASPIVCRTCAVAMRVVAVEQP